MDELMFKVPDGQDPYNAIGRYIKDNTTAIEDMIAVIEIDGVTINELLLVDMHEDGYFVWKSDWWEGEKDISLIDFFPVSDAQKPSAQPKIIYCKDCKKQNKHYHESPYKDTVCPLTAWRGMWEKKYPDTASKFKDVSPVGRTAYINTLPDGEIHGWVKRGNTLTNDKYADTLFFKGSFGSKKPLKVSVEITDDMVAEVTKSMVVDENTKFVD